MPRGSFKDIDKGWRHIVESMAKAANKPGAHVVVGWPGKAGSQQYPAGDVTVAEVAAFNEFGTATTPARSMIAATCDLNSEKYKQTARTIADGIATGRVDLAKGLHILGVMIKGDIQSRINDGIPPPNSASTIARKGSSKPLIDTGLMKNSIDHEVRDV